MKRPLLSLMSWFASVILCGNLPAQARDLTFEERVKAQETIERVYYSHQIGATKSFEEAVPQTVLEQKVRTYLKESVALEEVWNAPLTATMLWNESERIAKHTRMPARLKELYAALGNDSLLFQETLVRAVLVDRLARDHFANDSGIHAQSLREATFLRQGLVDGESKPLTGHGGELDILDVVVHERLGNDADLRDEPTRLIARGSRKVRLDVGPDEFRIWSASAPQTIGEIGPLVENRDAFVFKVALKRDKGELRVTTYVIKKRTWEDWLDEVKAEIDETRAQTIASERDSLGALAYVQEGEPGGGVGAPSSLDHLATGADSACVGDAWASMALAEAPSPRGEHTAIWTGNFMVVWGGFDVTWVNTGGRYNPVTDTWTPTSLSNAPSGRVAHAVVWTGNLMLVWGGANAFGGLDTGGRYDPVSNMWAPMSTTDAPSPRGSAVSVWTGNRMIVWAGANTVFFNTGGIYDPTADTWSIMSVLGAPAPRDFLDAIWTGNVMVVWGGTNGSPLGTGGRYDPSTDTWTPTSAVNAPSPRYFHTSIWTGSDVLVWGGWDGISVLGTGARYDPANDTWAPVTAVNAPSPRREAVSVWTGKQALVWGGTDFHELFNTGGRYDPATNTWDQMTTLGAPQGRAVHTEVWSGSEMLVWGGFGGTYLNSGGRYSACAVTCISNSYYKDVDGDGYGDPKAVVQSCTQPAGYVRVAGDCDDTNPAVQPGATEICDALDNNCDGRVDEGFDLGKACTADVDECHQIAGTEVCRSDGTGTECRGMIVFHDTTPPQFSLSTTPTALWPPNHRMVPVQVNWTVSDLCDPSPQVVLISMISSEPDDTPGSGDGSTTGDIQDASIGTPDPTVLLRAERSGDGAGRVYTLTYAARDASGNTASALGIVTVPHDEGTGPEPVMMSVEGDGTPGMAHLYWSAVSGAEMYDVIQGNLRQVSVANGEIRLGPVHVLASGQAGASYSDGPSGAIPEVGSAFFYLVQYREGQSASGWGTESSPWPAEPSSCDIGCPGEPVVSSVASMTIKRK